MYWCCCRLRIDPWITSDVSTRSLVEFGGFTIRRSCAGDRVPPQRVISAGLSLIVLNALDFGPKYINFKRKLVSPPKSIATPAKSASGKLHPSIGLYTHSA